MKKKLRNIVVDSDAYLYRVRRDDTSVEKESATIEVFRKDYKQTGDTDIVNIYAPGFVSRYIKHAVAKGWDASSRINIYGIEILAEWDYEVAFRHCYALDDENKATVLLKK